MRVHLYEFFVIVFISGDEFGLLGFVYVCFSRIMENHNGLFGLQRAQSGLSSHNYVLYNVHACVLCLSKNSRTSFIKDGIILWEKIWTVLKYVPKEELFERCTNCLLGFVLSFSIWRMGIGF